MMVLRNRPAIRLASIEMLDLSGASAVLRTLKESSQSSAALSHREADDLGVVE